MLNTQHLDNSFKQLLQQFYDTAIEDYKENSLRTQLGQPTTHSLRIDEVGNQLYQLFQTRLSIQGATNAEQTSTIR